MLRYARKNTRRQEAERLRRLQEADELEDMSVSNISKLQEEVQALREENERLRMTIESERLT
jgi:hypothetical protein